MFHLYGRCEVCGQCAERAYYPHQPHPLLACETCWNNTLVTISQRNLLAPRHQQQPVFPWPAAAFRRIAEDLVAEFGLALENGMDVDMHTLADRVKDGWYHEAKAALQALRFEELFVTCDKPGCGLKRHHSMPRCVCIEAEEEDKA